MTSLSYYAYAALYMGLGYLTGIVAYALIVFDLPATTSSPSDDKFLQKALDHYLNRQKTNLSYKLVPIACVLLTLGVISNVFLQRCSVGSILSLVAAFLTAYNNGSNVVDPANALAEKNEDKLDEYAVLKGVTRGHLVDLVGFMGIFVFSTFVSTGAQQGREKHS